MPPPPPGIPPLLPPDGLGIDGLPPLVDAQPASTAMAKAVAKALVT
jgi:hypothetical protein